MCGYLGIDTSNYTTSCALYRAGRVVSQKRLLPVPPGQVGLRQSDAVFSHIKALGELMEQLRADDAGSVDGIGVSARPRDVEGSYMPCFLAGLTAARTAAAAMQVPLHSVSHQAGHVAAALYGANRLDLIDRPFLAFHLSGGTTEGLWVKSLPQAQIERVCVTNDLNAGQVVDRVGHLLGLDFPAGPALEALAMQATGHERVKIAFSQGNPCLSGVENQCAARLQKGQAPAEVARYCLDAVLAALLGMVLRAIEATGCDTTVFAGGVMSNVILRRQVLDLYPQACFAPAALSCDNAVGVALLAALHAGETLMREGD